LTANASYWRDCAEKTRTIAKQMSNAEAKSKLLKLAEDYEQTAKQIEWQVDR
jgi:hypothetical protein